MVSDPCESRSGFPLVMYRPLTTTLLVGSVAAVDDTVADVLLGDTVLAHAAVEVALRAVGTVQLI